MTTEKDKERVIKRILEVYKKPFEYDRDFQMIFDKEENHVLDIRGWGRLQYLKEGDGGEIQDNLGELITEFLNKLEP